MAFVLGKTLICLTQFAGVYAFLRVLIYFWVCFFGLALNELLTYANRYINMEDVKWHAVIYLKGRTEDCAEHWLFQS